MTSLILCYVIAAYFLFIVIFSDSEYKVHATIIFLSSSLNIYFTLPQSTNITEYIYNRNLSILWDSVTMLILVAFIAFDRVAWKQALLLSFATLCHIMIICHLTIGQSMFSLFFYSYYDELVIMVGILQIMVSYNGFIAALRSIREHLFRTSLYLRRLSKGIPTYKKGRESP